MIRHTLSDMKQTNKDNGHHWFDTYAMKFFRTRIESQPNRHNIFITSEQPPGGKRAYALRFFCCGKRQH